jgi:alkylation response protein AidB-like acyl-CoA dehydrogenase
VRWVRALGAAGWLRHGVPAGHGGAHDPLQSLYLVIARETLARHSGLADFAFTMQGLGSAPITLAGSNELKSRYLPLVARGAAIAAFALTEPEAGSDVAAATTTAKRENDHYVLDGEKTFISNGGIADFYVVFARTGEAPGARGLSAFVVDAGTPGFEIAERIDVIAPHPLARLRFQSCRVPFSHLVGASGEGFKIAMRSLDIFRAGVAAAALGFARRALDEALLRATTRKMFGQTLGDFQLTQAALADMATEIDAAALLTYRAAWLRDVEGVTTTREAAMAKMAATEGAQRVIDRAVQMFGGLGVGVGSVVEHLYREIRPLRIYEGATEVQKLIIGRDLLKARN